MTTLSILTSLRQAVRHDSLNLIADPVIHLSSKLRLCSSIWRHWRSQHEDDTLQWVRTRTGGEGLKVRRTCRGTKYEVGMQGGSYMVYSLISYV